MQSSTYAPPLLQFTVNSRVYFRKGIAESYRRDGLQDDEIAALLKYQPCFVGRDVLDIGVGAGRTTKFLLPLAGHYECLDYSPEMVRFLDAAMPQANVRLQDMRDLGDYASASFDFVFASNNVISAVSLSDRLRVFSGIQRVLRTGGVCAMSAHNRNYRHALAGPRVRFSRNPVSLLKNGAEFALDAWNFQRMRRYRHIETEHALLNDPGHRFSLLHTYVSRDFQTRQLREFGFSVLDVFDRAGKPLAAEQDDSHSASLMYVFRAVRPLTINQAPAPSRFVATASML